MLRQSFLLLLGALSLPVLPWCSFAQEPSQKADESKAEQAKEKIQGLYKSVLKQLEASRDPQAFYALLEPQFAKEAMGKRVLGKKLWKEAQESRLKDSYLELFKKDMVRDFLNFFKPGSASQYQNLEVDQVIPKSKNALEVHSTIKTNSQPLKVIWILRKGLITDVRVAGRSILEPTKQRYRQMAKGKKIQEFLKEIEKKVEEA